MASRTVAGVMLGLIAATLSPFVAAQVSEQIETGHAHLANGSEVVFRIRLLPLASFPGLPPAIAVQLSEKGCMIPQTYGARGPENVIRGAFEKKGSDDWAVLCSVNEASTLYVFFESRPDAPIALRHQPDAEWLGAEILGAYGSAWGIALRRAYMIRPAQVQAVVDHDGIEDAFLEKSVSVHYFMDGSWVALDRER